MRCRPCSVCVALYAQGVPPIMVIVVVLVTNSGHVPVLRGATCQRARPSRTPKRSLLQRGLHGGMICASKYAYAARLWLVVLVCVEQCSRLPLQTQASCGTINEPSVLGTVSATECHLLYRARLPRCPRVLRLPTSSSDVDFHSGLMSR